MPGPRVAWSREQPGPRRRLLLRPAVTGYAMATVVMIPLSAWLSSLFGQRVSFIFCLLSFTSASMLRGLASNLPLLVMARLLQGLLGGGLLPKGQAMLLLPGALASGVGGPVMSRIDRRVLIATGALAMVATMASMATIAPDTGSDSLWCPLIFQGVTTVMMFLPLILATLGLLPRQDVGAGSGCSNLPRQRGGSFGIAVLTLVLDHQRAVHRAHLVESLIPTDPRRQKRLAELRLRLASRLGKWRNRAPWLTPIRSAMAAVLI